MYVIRLIDGKSRLTLGLKIYLSWYKAYFTTAVWAYDPKNKSHTCWRIYNFGRFLDNYRS